MVWALAGLVLCSMIYMASVIFKYTAFMGELRPLIKRLRERSEKLEKGVDSEKRLKDIVRKRVEEEKLGHTELKMTIADTEKALKVAQTREEQLETEKYKQDFKRSRGS